MKILKKLAALVAAGALAAGMIAPAYAAESDAGGASQTAEYKPVDRAEYIKWDGESKPKAGTNYYVDSFIKVTKEKMFVFPAGTTLLICDGANFQVYKDSTIFIKGKMIVEPKAKVTISGTFSVTSKASLENYGTIASTKSSLIKVSSDLTINKGASAVWGGVTNIYGSGNYINKGKTTFAGGSQTTVTGTLNTPAEGQLLSKGELAVSISGVVDQEGYFLLGGPLVNSGTFIFEKGADYYLGKKGKFSVSQSGRIEDKRGGGNIDVSDAPEKPESLIDKGIKGIDVSSWQETIDWNRVKKAGIDFAFIRSSFADDYVDKTFAYNAVEANKAGVKVGVYHYCYAKSTTEARAEARHFIETIKPYNIEYPVVLDFEDESQKKLSKTKLTAIARAFLQEIEDAGYYPMIYSYAKWFDENLDMNKLSKYEVWVAHWNVAAPDYAGSYGAWQYSSTGRVSGIEGDVDLDVSFKDYAKIIRDGGYNHLS